MTAPTSRPRPARRALDELSLPVDPATIQSLSAAGPDWLADDRAAAFAAYTSLPGESNLLYTPYIDLRAATLDDATIPTSLGGGRAATTLPDGADGLIEVTEGVLSGAAISPVASAAGVALRSLPDVLASDPARAQELLMSGARLPLDDKFAQLTRAFWSTGVVLDIPDGVRLEKPIIIRWRVGAPDRALLTRTIVRLGAGAHAILVEELTGSDEADRYVGGRSTAGAQAFFAGTTEAVLGAGASLHVAGLQELPDTVVVLQHRVAEVGEGGSLQWALAQLGGRLVRSRVDNRLTGDRSAVEQVEIVFGGDDQVFDLTSFTTHIGRDTTGNLLSKGALLDRARTYMKGLITIERTAIGTDSFLGEFGMNLSKAARSVAIPSLEIDQPDCRRAAHSSSVGPIDETQLFYLESRGIPPDEARKFIVLGFLEPVVARVPLASAQEHLRELLEEKWDAGLGGEAAA